MTETPGQRVGSGMAGVGRMDASKLDMVLVEGFKREAVAKDLTFSSGMWAQRGGINS